MKNLFFLFIILTFNIAAQTINIPLLVSDGESTKLLRVGVDPTATNGIDPGLGESDLPPCPPTGIFEARFDLNPYTGMPLSTYYDFRYADSIPFTGTHEHRLIWQNGMNATAFTVYYNLPENVTMQIQDLFGGIIINSNILIGSGAYTLPFNQITQVKLKMSYNNAGGGGAEDPVLVHAPLNLNFPQRPVGVTDTLSVRVVNMGSHQPLTINNIISTNNHFIITPSSVPINVPPLTSKKFNVIYTSDIPGQSGQIHFSHNASVSPAIVYVSASPAIIPGPIFHMLPSSLIFPQLPPGTTEVQGVTVTNVSNQGTLIISNITSNNNSYSVSPNIFPISILPQQFKNFSITYTSGDSLQQGIIEFTHNAPGSPAILNVSSVLPDAQFSLYPHSMYFHEPNMTSVAVVSNRGLYEPITISNIIISNSNYSITSAYTLPLTIAPNSSKIFHIHLNGAPGVQEGSITFIHNAQGSPHTLYLSNNQLEPQVKGKLLVKSGTHNGELIFGLDSTATDEIDQLLGENMIPPPPPMTAFDRRFILPQNNFSGTLNSYSDFRYGVAPFTVQKEYRIYYQQHEYDGIEICWDLPQGITGELQDIINGSFLTVPIADSGCYVIQDPLLFNKLKMFINYDIHNPVEFSSFTASASGNHISLKWTTATETNNSGFYVERRGEGEWKNIAFVPGQGNSTGHQEYTFEEIINEKGSVQYRLKQTDFDGTFTYSEIREVEIGLPDKFYLSQNYPNPFNPVTKIKFEIPSSELEYVPVKLKIYDLLGNEIVSLIDENKTAGLHEVIFNASELPSGIYIYRMQAGQFTDSKKLILIK